MKTPVSPRSRRIKNIRLYQTGRGSSIVTKSPAGLARAAARLVSRTPARVWLLSGSLGSGKTTFVRGALRKLGVRGVIASPTFTLAKIYRLSSGRIVFHLDAYRIRRQSEIAATGLFDALADPRCTVFIEWPERLRVAAWPEAVSVQFEIVASGRTIRWRRLAQGHRLAGGPRRRRPSPRR